MTGLDFFLRHVELLPEAERDALKALMAGRPYDKYAAQDGARRLWGRSIMPAVGWEEVL